MTRAYTVLVVDDHPLFRAGIAASVRAHDALEVVGECGDGSEALGEMARLDPDIVTLDVSLPGRNGFAVLKEAIGRACRARFVMITVHDDHFYRRKAQQLGAVGFASKTRDPEAIAELIVEVARAQTRRFRALTPAPEALEGAVPVETLEALDTLTEAERAVLAELAASKTSREIADALGTSVRTVQNHRAHICDKLGLSGSHRLLAVALSLRDALRID